MHVRQTAEVELDKLRRVAVEPKSPSAATRRGGSSRETIGSWTHELTFVRRTSARKRKIWNSPKKSCESSKVDARDGGCYSVGAHNRGTEIPPPTVQSLTSWREKKAAKERQGTRTDLSKPVQKSAPIHSHKQAADLVGTNRQYVNDCKKIKEKPPNQDHRHV